MNAADWNEKFGAQFLLTLSDEERRYLGLSEVCADWATVTFHSKTNLWYTRVTAFFEDTTVVKVISEEKRVPDDGVANYEAYTEYDTSLFTENRRMLLPLTSRGKLKSLSASSINAVAPFGCSFSILFETGARTRISLSNPRTN